MKLDRNENKDGTGKYGLVLMRRVTAKSPAKVHNSLRTLEDAGVIDYGPQGPSDGSRQFFVIRYRDKFAEPALRAYAKAARTEAQRLHAEAKAARSGDAAELCRNEARSMEEWAREIDKEADLAKSVKGQQIPD